MNNQANHELSIFSSFVMATKLAVTPNSIQKRQPPEPDILCSIEGRGDVAFELVEIVDESMARRDSDALRLRRVLFETYQNYLEEKRRAFFSRYGHCSIHVAFEENASYRDRAVAAPAVLDFLLCVAQPITGQIRFVEHRENAEQIYRSGTFTRGEGYVYVTFPQFKNRTPVVLLKRDSPILNSVEWVNIYRGSHLQGPLFGVDATGSFGECALDAIQKKFEKKYSDAVPIALLAFYEAQPVLPADLWFPQLSPFIEQNIAASPFEEIWVYDAARNQVIIHYRI